MSQPVENIVSGRVADEFEVTVRGFGLRVEIGCDGSVNVFRPKHRMADVVIHSSGEARKLGHAGTTLATNASERTLPPGATMPDGTVYAGDSPDTGGPMFTTLEDASLTCSYYQVGNPARKFLIGTLKEAEGHASCLDVLDHKDWRIPTKAELNVLFRNCAVIGGFDTSGLHPNGRYWSSSHGNHGNVWTQRFSDGDQDCLNSRYGLAALRLVRG